MAKLSGPRFEAPPAAAQVVSTVEGPGQAAWRLNFRVPEAFHRLVKVTAAQHGMIMSALIIQAFNEWLERRDSR